MSDLDFERDNGERYQYTILARWIFWGRRSSRGQQFPTICKEYMALIYPAMLDIAIYPLAIVYLPSHDHSAKHFPTIRNLLVKALKYVRSQPQKGSAQARLNPSFFTVLSLPTLFSVQIRSRILEKSRDGNCERSWQWRKGFETDS